MSGTDRTAALLSHISFTPGDPAPALVLAIGRTLNTLAKQDETQLCTPGQGTIFSWGEDREPALERGLSSQVHPLVLPAQHGTGPAIHLFHQWSGSTYCVLV